MTKKEFLEKIQSGHEVEGITKEEIIKKLSKYPDDYFVEEAYEGLIIYKKIEELDKYNYVDKIDTGNEKRRIQKILKGS